MTTTQGEPGRHERKAGAVLSYAFIGVQFLVAMAYTPTMLRLLGQTEYGLYSLTASVVSYLNLLTFGFGGAYMRFYARYRVAEDGDGLRRLNGTFLLLFAAVGLAAGVGGVVLSLNVEAVLGSQFSSGELATAQILFAVLTVNLVITFPTSVFTSYIIAHERFIFQKSLQLIRQIVSPLVILPLLLIGYKSIGMAVATTVLSLFFTAWTVVFAVRRLRMRFTFRGLRFSIFREIWVFSSFLFVNIIVDQVNWNVDKILVGRFHGAIPVSVYGVAALFNTYYLTFSTAISSVFVPRINTMVAAGMSDRLLSELFTRVGRVQFLILGLVISGVVFFGKPFIVLWAGPEYENAYYIALLLMVPVTIPLLQNLGLEIQKAKNMHHFRTWAYLALAVVNVIVTIPLAQRYGGIGAAAATAFVFVVGNGFIMNWYYQTRMGLDIRGFWRQILRLSLGMIPALVLGVVVSVAVDLSRIGLLVLVGTIYAIVYWIGMWLVGMNDYERQLIGGPARRILGRRR